MEQLTVWVKQNLRAILKVSGAIILVILLFDYVSNAGKKEQYEQNIAKWKAESSRILKQNDSVLKVVKQLEDHSDSLNIVAEDYSIQIAKLRVAANKTPRTIVKEIAKDLPDTCNTVLEALVAEQQRADKLDSALVVAEVRDTLRVKSIALLTTGNGLLRQENDSLRRLVLIVPVYKSPKLLGFIPYPSRKASFISGTVVGVTSVFVIRNNIR